MGENTARLLLHDSEEFFAERKAGRIVLLEADFEEEELPEEVLAKNAKKMWGIAPEKIKLLCILPKNKKEFIQYFASNEWKGSFDDGLAQEIVCLDFFEAVGELDEKTDIIAVQALEKLILGKSFERPVAKEEVKEAVHEKQREEARDDGRQNVTSTEDFEILPPMPKEKIVKKPEKRGEGIDFEFLSRGKG